MHAVQEELCGHPTLRAAGMCVIVLLTCMPRTVLFFACSRTQSWWAHNATDPEQRLFELRDGIKYLVGITWMPTGWELG
jgi:hypothetical protein